MGGYASEAAEQTVRIFLDGSDTFLKICGSGIRNTAELVYKLLKEEKDQKEQPLTSLLRSGQPFSVLTLDGEDEPILKKAAEKGSLPLILLRGKSPEGDVLDVVVPEKERGILDAIIREHHLHRMENTLRHVYESPAEPEKETGGAGEKNSDFERLMESTQRSQDSFIVREEEPASPFPEKKRPDPGEDSRSVRTSAGEPGKKKEETVSPSRPGGEKGAREGSSRKMDSRGAKETRSGERISLRADVGKRLKERRLEAGRSAVRTLANEINR